MPAKMGRPKVDNPKDIRYSIRLDADTEQRLQTYCAEHQLTRGKAIRKAIEMLLDEKKQKMLHPSTSEHLLQPVPYALEAV